jgi:hypothetical protein
MTDRSVGTWQQIARQVATALTAFATCEDHPPTDPDLKACPACTAREGKRMYEAKLYEHRRQVAARGARR